MKTGQVKRELGRLAAREKERESLLTDESHVDRTAALAAEACRMAMERRGMGFPAFVARQIRYTGRYVWIWQGLLLLLIVSGFDLTAGMQSLFVRRRHPVGLELRALLCQIRHMEDDRGGGGGRVLAPAADGAASHHGSERCFDGAGSCRGGGHILDYGSWEPRGLAFPPLPAGLEFDPVPSRQGEGEIFCSQQQRCDGGGISPLCPWVEICEPGSGRATGLYGNLRVCVGPLRGGGSSLDFPDTETWKKGD